MNRLNAIVGANIISELSENMNMNMNMKLTLDKINEKISMQFCKETYESLSDKNLLHKYKECKSVKKNIENLKQVLQNNNISSETQTNIIDEYIIGLIPAGTKGVIRGNKFNNLVKNYINSLNLSTDRFEIEYEKKHDIYITSEIPDWYIYDKENKKIIIGMNQLDLWGGGQQYNRGYKYLFHNHHNNQNSKLVCVVCNFCKITSVKNKTYRLFEKGFTDNTLCYINGIKDIVYEYFNM
jgi:hypothetical protein